MYASDSNWKAVRLGVQLVDEMLTQVFHLPELQKD